MPKKAMKPKRLPVNPNWLQLQEKLKGQGFRARKPSIGSETGTLKSAFGKRKERSDDDEDSNDSQSSVLTPINSDCSVTDEIAMDCEMVGVSSQGNKSALGRVSVVNMWGNVIYDEFVRPVERVVDYRTEISGIRPRDLRKAKDFQVVQKDVSELIKGKILVGHALRNDLKALLLSHPKNYTRDTSEFHSFLKEGRKRSLRSLAAEFLNVKIQDGEHCPIQDAQAAMLLYQKNKKEWERGIKDHLRFKGKNKGKRPKKTKKVKKQNTTTGLRTCNIILAMTQPLHVKSPSFIGDNKKINLSWKEAAKPATYSTTAAAPGGKRTATTAAHGANNGANKKGRGEGGVRNQLMNRALEGLSPGGRGARGRGGVDGEEEWSFAISE